MTSILFLAIDGLRYDLLVDEEKASLFPNLHKLIDRQTSVLYPGETSSISMSAASWSTILSGKIQHISNTELENSSFDLVKKGRDLSLLNDIKKNSTG